MYRGLCIWHCISFSLRAGNIRKVTLHTRFSPTPVLQSGSITFSAFFSFYHHHQHHHHHLLLIFILILLCSSIHVCYDHSYTTVMVDRTVQVYTTGCQHDFNPQHLDESNTQREEYSNHLAIAIVIVSFFHPSNLLWVAIHPWSCAGLYRWHLTTCNYSPTSTSTYALIYA